MIDHLLIDISKRIRDLEQSVFQNPPIDMYDLSRRLGRWTELNESAAWLKERMRRLEEDIDEDSHG